MRRCDRLNTFHDRNADEGKSQLARLRKVVMSRHNTVDLPLGDMAYTLHDMRPHVMYEQNVWNRPLAARSIAP